MAHFGFLDSNLERLLGDKTKEEKQAGVMAYSLATLQYGRAPDKWRIEASRHSAGGAFRECRLGADSTDNKLYWDIVRHRGWITRGYHDGMGLPYDLFRRSIGQGSAGRTRLTEA